MTDEQEFRRLEKDVAVLTSRVDGIVDRLDDIFEESRWMRRLLISTLLSVLVGVALAAVSLLLAL